MDALGGLYSSKGPPLKELKFVPATRDDKVPIPEGINLIVLDGGGPTAPDMPRTAKNLNKAEVSTSGRELFDASQLTFEWNKVKNGRPGCGLRNLGNTCFLNSVLQCLTHTPALAEHFLTSRPYPTGKTGALRNTQDLIMRAFHSRVFEPMYHIKTMRLLNKSFRPGRQEDAHEYFIALLDAMHENLLEGLKPKPTRSEEATSMIYSIFAGRMRSQVKCTECGYESNTLDPFLDISLEINRAQTLEKALERFTADEYLDGGNKYKCPRHSSLVRAVKRMAIEKAPNVLCVHFKRFEYSMYGQKIGKKVDFGTSLNLAPFMADRRSPPLWYDLYAVLVHQGFSVHSGHYYAFVKAPNGLWYQMNDEVVSQVSERVPMAQKAYILFYRKKSDSSRPTGARQAANPASQEAPGPKASDGGLGLRNGHPKNKPKVLDSEVPPSKKPKPGPEDSTGEEQGTQKRKRPNESDGDKAHTLPSKSQKTDPGAKPSSPRREQRKVEASHGAVKGGAIQNAHTTKGAQATWTNQAPVSSPSRPAVRGGLMQDEAFRAQDGSAFLRPSRQKTRRGAALVSAMKSSPHLRGKSYMQYLRSCQLASQRRTSSASLLGVSPRSTPRSTPPLLESESSGAQAGKQGQPLANGVPQGQQKSRLGSGSPERSPKTVRQKRRKAEAESDISKGATVVDAAGGGAAGGGPPVANGGLSKPEPQPRSPRSPRLQEAAAKAVKKTTDRQVVDEVLGRTSAALGPSGVEPWDAGSDRLASHTAPSPRSSRHQLDDYDKEYDKGKTRKIRGAPSKLRQDGNVFQEEFSKGKDSRRKQQGRPKFRS